MRIPRLIGGLSSARTTLLLVAVAWGLSGCVLTFPGKVTGGGSIPSAGGSGNANFGINADSCSGTVKGHFNYHDMNADPTTWPGGVKMNGDVTDVAQCGPEQTDFALIQ